MTSRVPIDIGPNRGSEGKGKGKGKERKEEGEMLIQTTVELEGHQHV